MPPIMYHYEKFPPKNILWETLVPLIGPVNSAIARYDGVLRVIPNSAVLLSPLSTQDAVLSSRIEGTQATMGEVLEYEAGKDIGHMSEDKKNDIQEILNYRSAMLHAVNLLKELPISQRLIKETHRVLLDSVRGKNKSPGEYRRIPNWIGPHGCTIDTARFVPVSADKLPGAMSLWENYLHSEQPDKLVQLAILHAEFEAIHPFLDGNGRLGRMVVPLFLYHIGLIKSPMFYISAYFESNRDEYYDRLRNVSANGDWTGWCVFFLNALKLQAEENMLKATAILNLYNELKIKIPELTHSQYAIRALDWIFERPIFKSNDFTDSSGIPPATARRILEVLRNKANGEILKTLIQPSGRRSAVYMIPALLNIAEGYPAF